MPTAPGHAPELEHYQTPPQIRSERHSKEMPSKLRFERRAQSEIAAYIGSSAQFISARARSGLQDCTKNFSRGRFLCSSAMKMKKLRAFEIPTKLPA